MEPKVNYFAVGLFVLGLVAAFLLALAWFSSNDKKTYDTYLVYVKEAVSGLNKNASVKFNGVDVGMVQDIRINPADSQQVILVLQIEEQTPIDQSTTATLTTQGITGVMSVGLKAGAPHAPRIPVLPGNLYPIIPYTPSILFKLDVVLNELTSSMRAMSGVFQNVFSPENEAAINHTLVHLAKITQTVDAHSKQLGEGVDRAATTLNHVSTATEAFSQQTLPGMTDSLARLNRLLGSLERLTTDLTRNPSMLIRGQGAKPLGPGE